MAEFETSDGFFLPEQSRNLLDESQSDLMQGLVHRAIALALLRDTSVEKFLQDQTRMVQLVGEMRQTFEDLSDPFADEKESFDVV